jgi:esterase/lipase
MGEEGCVSKGIAGLSMGGVHASMAAGLYPAHDLGVVPMLAPRSAAVAYCDGAMRVRTYGRACNPVCDGC